ncbi:phosphate-starvation-inducible PsiE family protein [Candidatus Manganitrophus noduliformans]|uniref:Uncharacterized protein n=1 Tax=Candidatus Manganitrophus noduliformans TaxID=2606439 RepID=A0A7X6DM59_9BACT|nr:phosphate-starvation-inducible PsiE family protein [Candidatus Manganitrophus noduliformans]NKE69453.1 hypothetical protein [Candidatus Manganitrophus noduliformans]
MAEEQKTAIYVGWMERLEQWGYVTAGLSFLILGMVVFGYGWVAFYRALNESVLLAAMLLMNDLLLVLILLELFRTVLNFLKTHTVSLESFFYVGIVAAIRKILTTGAKETYFDISKAPRPDEAGEFYRYLMDTGLNGLLILVLVVAMFVYRRFLVMRA